MGVKYSVYTSVYLRLVYTCICSKGLVELVLNVPFMLELKQFVLYYNCTVLYCCVAIDRVI